MAIDIEKSVQELQEDLSPIKIKVDLEVDEHVYFVKFEHLPFNASSDYWQNYWGMDFSRFVSLWMKRYFKTITLDSATESTARFRLGSLLDFLKNSQHDV